MAPTRSKKALLDRYVPRIATNWDSDAPGRQWQELDASLCFVDISGFTNLSEKLSRRGRIGAEELTSVLDFVFGSMLEIAYSYGGSLLKFGGDALLLMFTDDEGGHAMNAVSAAVEMRAALRRAVDYQTSVGRLRLRMSVGIHSGTIHLFRAGDSHQELVIAGPGGTTTTAMEQTAEAGEIVISSGTKERLPQGAASRAKGDGWVLGWRKSHVEPEGARPRPTRAVSVVEAWVPPLLREYLSAGDPEPEHRIVSVGFVRLCGVDARMAQDGPDRVAADIDASIRVIQEAALAEDVTFLATDINEDGAKAILVAGAPVAREDSEGRLLRAMRRIADADTPLDIHMGANRGHVFTTQVGTPFRTTFTVMGDTVNLSARLASAAHAGTIYATPGILDQSATMFDSSALEPFHVKGKDDAVVAYDVGDEVGDRPKEARDELPFVGRTEELAALTKAVSDAAGDGRGSVTVIVADTGFGKTRLVRQALRTEPDLPVVTIGAEPYGAATPYRPLRDPIRTMLGIERGSNEDMARALRQRIDAMAPDLAPMIPLIADVAAIDVEETPEVAELEPRFRQDRLTAVMVSLLDRVLTEPMVVSVEDAQWMDEASSHLLGVFAKTSHERPWAIVVTRRGVEGGLMPPGADVIELGELSAEDAEQLVVAATQATPLRPHDVATIVERTGGNPLFMAEMLRIVTETGNTSELPDSLGTLVSSSIDALPPLTRNTLRFVSVFGRSFRTSTVRTTLQEDGLELDAATRELLTDFLEPDGRDRLRFRTAMVRDVAYDGLSFRRRIELHGRAAKAIAATTNGDPESAADQLAMHYSLANDHENAWRFSRIAAERAARAYANAEAATQLERALAAGRRLDTVAPDDLADTWARLGEMLGHLGRYEDALAAYRRSSHIVAGDPSAEAELLLKRARMRRRAGDYSMALREATQAQRVAETASGLHGDDVSAKALALKADFRRSQGRVREAYRTAAEAADVAERVSERSSLATAFSVMAWAQMTRGEPDALELSEKALELYADLGDLIGQSWMSNNLGVLAYFEGRWDDSIEYYERGRDGAQRVGNVGLVAEAEANIGELLLNQLRLDEAEQHLLSAVRTARSTGDDPLALFAEMQLARVYAERGETDRAISVLSEVATESRELDNAANAAEATIYLAECMVFIDQHEDALDGIERALVEAGEEAPMYELMALRVRAEALAKGGRADEASDVFDDGLAMARERGQRYEEALVLRARARAVEKHDPDTARRCRDEATKILASFGVQV